VPRGNPERVLCDSNAEWTNDFWTLDRLFDRTELANIFQLNQSQNQKINPNFQRSQNRTRKKIFFENISEKSTKYSYPIYQRSQKYFLRLSQKNPLNFHIQSTNDPKK